MGCQDKVAQWWDRDSGHLFDAGRNDGGIMCAEGPLGMHFLSYKGKGWRALLLLEPPSLSLNCTCRHYCFCDYRHSGELAVTHLLPPPSPITASVPRVFLTTLTLEFPPFLLFALFFRPVMLHWYNKSAIFWAQYLRHLRPYWKGRKNSQLWSFQSSSYGSVCKSTTHGRIAQNGHFTILCALHLWKDMEIVENPPCINLYHALWAPIKADLHIKP